MSIIEARKPTNTNYSGSDLNLSVEEDPRVSKIQLNSRVIDEEKLRWKNFVIYSSAFYFSLMIPMIIAVILRLYYYKTLKHIYHEFSELMNGYDIVALVCLVGILVSANIVDLIPKKAKPAIALILTVCWWYFAGFLMRYASKKDMGNWQTLVLIYTGLICAVFALLINAILNYRKLRVEVSFAIAATLYLAIFIFYTKIYKNKHPLLIPAIPSYFLYPSFCGVFAAYLSMTLSSMIRNRAGMLDYDDWVTGCVFLQTDIFYYFWYELFYGLPEESEEDEMKSGKQTHNLEKSDRSRIESFRTDIDL